MIDLKHTKYMRDLRRKMAANFELDELQALAFDLQIDWQELPSDQKYTGCQSLIRYLAEHGRLLDLVTLLQEERPGIDWPEVPPGAQQIRDVQATIPDATREEILRTYLGQMRRQLVESRTEAIGEYSATDIAVARTLTNDVFARLDKARLLVVARFLGEIHLSYLIDLREADLTEADLREANLSKADLCQADLRWANLSGADLSEANLNKADLRQANLRKADLRKADLTGADFRDASMGGANLSGARLKGALLPARYIEWLEKQLAAK